MKIEPENKPLDQTLKVDVFTTAMPGEPYDMFDTTLRAVAAMHYPHTSYLMDGGNDHRLKKLCKNLGIVHVDTRNVNGAKAGKINYCIRNFSKGDFIFVVDPDHIPEPDALDKILPSFCDEKVGFVQVVQPYYNRNESFVAYAAAEETFGFYGPMQLALNGIAIPTAIGANCTFRRSALEAIGGHAEDLAEDALTSMRIHAAGYKSVYVEYRATKGLVPADLGSFFKQQLKWSNGMFNLFFHQYPRLFKNFPMQAKIHYFFAGTYYFNGLDVFFMLVLPIFFLFFQIFAVEMRLSEFIIHFIPYIVTSSAITIFIQRYYSDKSERGIPWRSMGLERGTWHIYMSALYCALIGRNIPYLPTPKMVRDDRAPRLVYAHIVIIALSLMAIIFPFLFYYRIDDGTILMMGFAALNVLLLLPVVKIGLFGQRRNI